MLSPYIFRGLLAMLLPSLSPSQPPHRHQCATLPASPITIEAYQLYPKNMSWDTNICQAYISVLCNSSVGVYNPFTAQLSIAPIPGPTLSPTYHIAGVIWDKYSSLVSAVVTQALAFRTGGCNISGDNWLNKYDPVARKFLWSTNLTTVTQNRDGGFNDITHDKEGNTWVCGTFPGMILIVDKTG